MLKKILHLISGWGSKDPKSIEFHPDYDNKPIKWCFTINDVHYYQFKKDTDLPKNRYTWLSQFAEEADMKMTKDSLIEFMKDIQELCNKNNLVGVVKLSDEVIHRAQWAFEQDTLFRLASCVYFPLDEDVVNYDHEYNLKKIQTFKENEKKNELIQYILQSFYPDNETYLGLSLTGLTNYLTELNERKEKQRKLIQSLKRKKDSTRKTTQTS